MATASVRAGFRAGPLLHREPQVMRTRPAAFEPLAGPAGQASSERRATGTESEHRDSRLDPAPRPAGHPAA